MVSSKHFRVLSSSAQFAGLTRVERGRSATVVNNFRQLSEVDQSWPKKALPPAISTFVRNFRHVDDDRSTGQLGLSVVGATADRLTEPYRRELFDESCSANSKRGLG